MRQAVIVIHGIGEQKPMDTLRRFVNSLLSDPVDATRGQFHSKPDRMSESFELRKLLLPQSRRRPITDFYEYYWAYHVSGTKYQHIVSWLRNLLFRRPRNVPTRLLPLWILTWLLIAAVVGTPAVQIVGPQGLAGWWNLSAGTIGWLATVLIIPAMHAIVLSYVGDAARYLSPTSTNIATRQKIRGDGIRLLRRLHRSGDYDRIIVVGHSLGSVIAYDLLKHLWPEMNHQHGRRLQVDQSCLKELEMKGRALVAQKAPQDKDVLDFQEVQRQLWLEQRTLGNPWLVTDLITLGSPLVHAEFLLAKDRSEMEDRQEEYELPTCPPQPVAKGRYSYKSGHYKVQQQKRTIRLLHHAAHFACTRWTNIYFPGDLVGGPIRTVFGQGVRDLRVTAGGLGRLLQYTLASHTRYWHTESQGKDAGKEPALDALRSALDLESKDWLR